MDEFDWDSQVEPEEVGVEVDDGVVTLKGTVDRYTKKISAEQAALRVEGVRAVPNHLSAHFSAIRTDTDIAKSTADVLEANSLISPGEIDVSVNNGDVRLTGKVTWEYQRKAAMHSVQYLPGVRDVFNLVTIRPPKASALAIKSGIEASLIRAAEVDANRIEVHTDGGHVRLTGTVRFWAEQHAASEAAWRSKGVTRVDNEINIRPM